MKLRRMAVRPLAVASSHRLPRIICFFSSLPCADVSMSCRVHPGLLYWQPLGYSFVYQGGGSRPLLSFAPRFICSLRFSFILCSVWALCVSGATTPSGDPSGG